MVLSMAKRKTTVTLDQAKVDTALGLTGARSTSSLLDLALERLIAAERLRSDLRAYGRHGPDSTEVALGSLPVTLDLEDDDVDYDALYGG